MAEETPENQIEETSIDETPESVKFDVIVNVEDVDTNVVEEFMDKIQENVSEIDFIYTTQTGTEIEFRVLLTRFYLHTSFF